MADKLWQTKFEFGGPDSRFAQYDDFCWEIMAQPYEHDMIT